MLESGDPPERQLRVLDSQRLATIAEKGAADFAVAHPFPHVVIDDFLPEDVADAVAAEYALVEERWKHYNHVNEKKRAITDLDEMSPRARALFEDFNSQAFVEFMARLTGIADLVADPDLEGAGMHMSRRGGYLNVHADFLTHTRRRNWSRQLNLLVYLNRDWQEEWSGNLELWNEDMTECVVQTAPVFNRAVVFHTLPHSFHGHPHPLTCPDHVARKSLAVYYYRDEGVPGRLSSTDYRPVPSDSRWRRMLIAADRKAVALYTFAKGRIPISDKMLSRILKRF